ncbi:hypothetical protein AHF37_02633 [Paragonimus kellicotti]|nr:hypothetical protein AHF37_02633 [Paragonimus kellicotti]
MPENLCASLEAIQKTADFIENRIRSKPTVGIICGSGLGKLANVVKNPQLLKYEDIPNFPCTHVIGHEGNLIFGELGGKTVVVMQGRFHLYEGYGGESIIIPIRLMKILGVDTLLVTNAAGGLNRNLKLGDLVIIKDHISLPGLALKNVLIGPNDEQFGTRFVATSDSYDVKLRRAFQAIVQQQGYSKIVHEGIYVHVGGPTYESPAENRMLMLMGADVVVIGHEGNLIFGELGGKTVVVMQGRFHLYEGYGGESIIIPIRLMKILGVDTLLVTNAAGGLNRNLKLGDLVIIKDHISLPGLALKNVLIGPNDEQFGTRFVATSDSYDLKLRRAFQAIVQQQGYSKIVHEGIYVHVGGPTYESPAENRMLMLMGADVVGMSTAPEVVVARHAGIRVFAISLVTNISVLSEESTEKASHEEVLHTAATRTEILGNLFTELVAQI